MQPRGRTENPGRSMLRGTGSAGGGRRASRAASIFRKLACDAPGTCSRAKRHPSKRGGQPDPRGARTNKRSARKTTRAVEERSQRRTARRTREGRERRRTRRGPVSLRKARRSHGGPWPASVDRERFVDSVAISRTVLENPVSGGASGVLIIYRRALGGSVRRPVGVAGRPRRPRSGRSFRLRDRPLALN